MMDFFAQQEGARRRTVVLVALFILATSLMIGAAYISIVLLVSSTPSGMKDVSPYDLWWWHPTLFVLVSAILLLIIGGGSLAKIAELRGGGDSVARMLGARRVSARTTDPDERRLLNIIEEMSLASGLTPPMAYVLDGEPGINAFAAGYTTDAAVVCVTEGALRRLTRDELQGVVAHEFSHILNGDMRLNIRLIGVVHGLLLVALIGQALLRSLRYGGRRRSRDSSKAAALILLIGLVLLVFGSIGVFLGRLIQAAVSRQREFLADAAAVQFTRNPFGLLGALKKILRGVHGSFVTRQGAEEVSHMFFARGLRGGLFDLFATHPPLLERIRRLGGEAEATQLAAQAMPPADTLADLGEAPPAVAKWTVPEAEAAVDTTALPVAKPPTSLLEAIGNPWGVPLAVIQRRMERLPPEVRLAASDPDAATALLFALFMDTQKTEVRARQREIIRLRHGEAMLERTDRVAAALPHVEAGMRFGLVDIALPMLRELEPELFECVEETMRALAEADATMTLFEYATRRVLHDTYWRHRTDRRRVPRRSPALTAEVPSHLSCLLSAVAWAGQNDPETARQAFEHAAQLTAYGHRLTFLPLERCTLAAVDRALSALAQLPPLRRKRVLQAVLACIAYSGGVEPDEADLFRAVSAALDAPVAFPTG